MKAGIDIMNDLTYIDYDGISVPLGYYYDPVSSVLKVPRGYTLPRLQSRIKSAYEYTFIDMPDYEYNNAGWDVQKTPYDYQEEIIETITRAYDKGVTQYIIDLVGGKGKTLTSLFIAAKMNVPVLIICKSTELIKQWYSGLLNKTTCKVHDIYNLKGLGAVNYVESMTYTHPIYISTHATIRNIISTYGYKVFNRMLLKMGVGLKIIDEFDTEFKNIIDIDLNSAIKYNLYLTATVYKNGKGEDKVFQATFKGVKRIGGEMFEAEVPNRVCDWVIINSHPDPSQRNLVYNFNRKEFNAYRYNDYLFKSKKDDVLIPFMKEYIPKFRDTSDKDDVCIIYCEKKESCFIMSEILITYFEIPARDVGVVNSDIDEYNKNENMKKKYICTTAKSMGRGIDVSNMVLGINLEVYAGESIFEQQVFRLGRVGSIKEGRYVNLVDSAFAMIVTWNRAKLDLTDKLFKVFVKKYFDCESGEYKQREDEL